MVITVEAAARTQVSKKGRGRGLARLRHECHRFREEVVCIRSFPQLHRRWPSLARLEIDDESSGEDRSVWDLDEIQSAIPATVSVDINTGVVASAESDVTPNDGPEVPQHARGGSHKVDDGRKVLKQGHEKVNSYPKEPHEKELETYDETGHKLGGSSKELKQETEDGETSHEHAHRKSAPSADDPGTDWNVGATRKLNEGYEVAEKSKNKCNPNEVKSSGDCSLGIDNNVGLLALKHELKNVERPLTIPHNASDTFLCDLETDETVADTDKLEMRCEVERSNPPLQSHDGLARSENALKSEHKLSGPEPERLKDSCDDVETRLVLAWCSSAQFSASLELDRKLSSSNGSEYESKDVEGNPSQSHDISFRLQNGLETDHKSGVVENSTDGIEFVETRRVAVEPSSERKNREHLEWSCDPILELETAGQSCEESSISSQNSSDTDLDSVENCSNGEAVHSLQTYSGARIAATATFTANPHHKIYDLSPQRSPLANFQCQSEGSTRFGVPSSNTLNGVSAKERDVPSKALVSPSGFQSVTCSSPKINAYPAIDFKDHTFKPLRTNLPEGKEGTDCEAASNFGTMRSGIHPTSHLMSLESPEASECTLKVVGYVLEEVQTRDSLRRTDFLNPATKPSESADGHQKWQMGESKHNLFSPPGDDCEGHESQPLTMVKQGTTSSSFRTSGLVQGRANQRSTSSEIEEERGTVKHQERGNSSLIALSGLESLTKLGGGSSRDAAMAARMATRIKDALERLGDRNSPHNSSIGQSESNCHWSFQPKGPSDTNTGTLANKYGESYVNRKSFSLHAGNEQRQEKVENNKDTNKERWDLSHSVNSAGYFVGDHGRPEEPELYLQHVIAALDSGHESSAIESTPCLKSPASTVGSARSEHHEAPLHEHSCAHETSMQVHGSGIPVDSAVKLCECSEKNKEETLTSTLPNGSRLNRALPFVEESGSGKRTKGIASDNTNNSNRDQPLVEEGGSSPCPGFTVEISAPGSFVEVEVGGVHSTIVYDPQEQISHKDAQVGSEIGPISKNSSRNTTDSLPSVGRSSLSDSKNPNNALSLQETTQSARVPIGKSSAKSSKVVRFLSHENTHDRFNRKIGNLVHRACQVARGEEESIQGDGAECCNGSGSRPRQVTGGKIRSILKSRTSAPEFSGWNQSNESQATATHRTPFSTAAFAGDKKVRTPEITSLLKSPRVSSPAAEGYDYYHTRESHNTDTRERFRDSGVGTAVVSPKNKAEKTQTPSTLKPALKKSTPYSGYSEDEETSTARRLEEFGAAAAGLASELQVLIDSRIPELSAVHTGQSSPTELVGASAIRQTRQRPYSEQQKRLKVHNRSANQPSSPKLVPNSRHSKLEGAVAMATEAINEAIRAPVLQVPSDKSPSSTSKQEKAMTGAKKIAHDLIGGTFDYDQFLEELEELQTERKKVEWMGRQLKTLNSDVIKAQPKLKYLSSSFSSLELQEEASCLSRGFMPDATLAAGSKRHRNATSPLREKGKKLLRSDNGRGRFSIDQSSNVENLQVYAVVGDSDLSNTEVPNVFNNTLKHLTQKKTNHEPQGYSGPLKSQDRSISRKSNHKLITDIKRSIVRDSGAKKSEPFTNLAEGMAQVTPSESASDLVQRGQKFIKPAIRRKSLRPPGSMFKVGKIVHWFSEEIPMKKGTLKTHPPADKKEKLIVGLKDRKEVNGNSPRRSKVQPDAVKSRDSSTYFREDLDGPTYRSRSQQHTKHSANHREIYSPERLESSTESADMELKSLKYSGSKGRLPLLRGKKTVKKSQPSSLSSARRSLAEQGPWSERMKSLLAACGALESFELPSFPEPKRKGERPHVSSPSTMGKKLRDVEKAKTKVKRLQRKDKSERPKSLRLIQKDRHSEGRGKNLEPAGKIGPKKPSSLTGPNVQLKEAHTMFMRMSKKDGTGKTTETKAQVLQTSSKKPRKGPNDMDMYASTLALLELQRKERANFTEKTRGKEAATRSRGMQRMRLKGNEVETEKGILERLFVGLEGTLEESMRRNSQAEASTLKQNFRLSVENWLNASGGFEYLDTHCQENEMKIQSLRNPAPNRVKISTSASEFSEDPSVTKKDPLKPFIPQGSGEGVQGLLVDSVQLRKDPSKRISRGLRCGIAKSSYILHHNADNLSPQGPGCETEEDGKGEGGQRKRRSEKEKVREVREREGAEDRLPWMEKSSVGQVCDIDFSVALNVRSHGQLESGNAGLLEETLQQVHTDIIGTKGTELPIHREDGDGPQGAGATLRLVKIGDEAVVNKGFDRSENITSEATELQCMVETHDKDKLTEDEEIEIALLEIVLQTILRDDDSKNSGKLPDEENPSVAGNGRNLRGTFVDQGVQALVLNFDSVAKEALAVAQTTSPDPSYNEDWPEYKCLEERLNTSESCEEDEDWPEYLGMDEQDAEEDGKGNSDQAGKAVKVSSAQISMLSGTETSQKVPSQGPPTPSSESLQGTDSSTRRMEGADRRPAEFPGISSLAFASNPPNPPLNKFVSCPQDRSSVSVQTTGLPSAPYPAVAPSVFVVPFYCSPDGRPLLLPYPMYAPSYPISEGHSQTFTVPMPPSMQGLHIPPATTSVAQSVQTADEVDFPKSKILNIIAPETNVNILEGRRKSPTTSTDSPSSSPTTPSTLVSSPEHEARVASALRYYSHSIRSQVHSLPQSDMDDNDKMSREQEDFQTNQTVDPQHLESSRDKGYESRITDSVVGNKQRAPSPPLTAANALRLKEPDAIPPLYYYPQTEGETRKFRKSVSENSVNAESSRSAELVGSYDGSGSSEGSQKQKRYTSIHVSPQSSLEQVDDLQQIRETSARPPSTTMVARSMSPGEFQNALAMQVQQRDGFQENLERHSWQTLPLLREKTFGTWSKPIRDGIRSTLFSEGEIEAGGLPSDGECGQIYFKVWGEHLERMTEDQDEQLSEPGEISRWSAQHMMATRSSLLGDHSGSLSLSEGEVRAEIPPAAEHGEVLERNRLGDEIR